MVLIPDSRLAQMFLLDPSPHASLNCLTLSVLKTIESMVPFTAYEETQNRSIVLSEEANESKPRHESIKGIFEPLDLFVTEVRSKSCAVVEQHCAMALDW